MEPSVLGATPPGERIVWLDVLRGAALFGIAQINFPSFAAGAMPLSTLIDAHAGHAVQGFVALLIFFISAKFYPVFAFLFGYGHALQRQRLRSRGLAAEPLLVRRYLVLLGMGVIHGAGFFFGDILTIYAVAGLALLVQQRYSPGDAKSRVLSWAGVSLVLALCSLALQDPQPADIHQTWQRMLKDELAQIRTGQWISVLRARAALYGLMQLQEFASFLPQVLMFMSAGIWAAEQGALSDPKRHPELFRRAMAIGLAVGVPVNLALVVAELEIINQLAAPLGLAETLDDLAFFLSLAYLGAFGLYAARNRSGASQKPDGPASRPVTRPVFESASGSAFGGPWLRFFSAMGRLSLTNYLVQSLVMMLLWYRFSDPMIAFGVVPAMALCALLVCILQGFLSILWLARFRQGPMEALWRRLTYTAAPASSNS